jgi:hypothetical protein
VKGDGDGAHEEGKPIALEDQILSTAEIKANELLGEVKGAELFQSLATRSLISNERRSVFIALSRS